MKKLFLLAASLALNCAAAIGAETVSVKVKEGGASCQVGEQQVSCAALSGLLEKALKKSPRQITVTPEGCGEKAMDEAKAVAETLKQPGFKDVIVVGFLSEPGKNCDAPAGYEWYVFEAGNTACLRPLEWFVKTEVKGDTAAMFFSQEDIDKEGEFKTGLTLNVLSRIQKKTGRPPSQYARDYLDALLANFPDAKRFEDPPVNGVKGISAVYVDEAKAPPVVIYTSLLADDQSNVLRIFILESPQTEWRETWALGERTLDCKIRR